MLPIKWSCVKHFGCKILTKFFSVSWYSFQFLGTKCFVYGRTFGAEFSLDVFTKCEIIRTDVGGDFGSQGVELSCIRIVDIFLLVFFDKLKQCTASQP